MNDPAIITALAPLEGEWRWQFLEDGEPREDRHLTILAGEAFEAGLPCTVELAGGEVRIRLSDNACELRFRPERNEHGEIAATFWALPAGVDDLDTGAALELLEDAVLIPA